MTAMCGFGLVHTKTTISYWAKGVLPKISHQRRKILPPANIKKNCLIGQWFYRQISTNIERMTSQPVPHPSARHSHAHPHVHSQESLQKLVNRLSRIEGHIRGVKTMVQENRPCPEVLIQVAAVRGALDRVARLILDDHMNECITRAAAEGNIEQELAELKEALDRFL
ncbi:sll0176 [Synechocystis sp. PCC 6803]|uniref:Sll0176 protein n=2 Tax=Synechocystis TaxID=1142 RepID=Q55554_SYNY3|nr:hypothetical protein MYO_121090 [Synechocystis sp. PCC 6803]MBD2619016.1 metal-sensitive transcriptional regulator [Synechocystis sp. FACHB-898]MBD2640219.1 metal-sensitive transcriptional regulator [Synechocystis sp. FACHB-908]MBD2661689.1 metal-sensitive transcriptional regulator [Synechocystis sp. FACHB-929]BAL29835.1 hypothetical protein SYNGTI_2088 [Synechocystis sp. PCC 6803 substr. GT-I]BAL33004.1 hypothetical protein SYNPCCN_2087 [Synechocystis sp. PCC 6803 substr. PCC-N]BAL36173.1